MKTYYWTKRKNPYCFNELTWYTYVHVTFLRNYIQYENLLDKRRNQFMISSFNIYLSFE